MQLDNMKDPNAFDAHRLIDSDGKDAAAERDQRTDHSLYLALVKAV
jgi:hypothetical protein